MVVSLTKDCSAEKCCPEKVVVPKVPFYFRSPSQNGLCCFRVGQADAERRQDIVLSGAHIREEHCIFRSERNANGDGELLGLLFVHRLVFPLSADEMNAYNTQNWFSLIKTIVMMCLVCFGQSCRHAGALRGIRNVRQRQACWGRNPASFRYMTPHYSSKKMVKKINSLISTDYLIHRVPLVFLELINHSHPLWLITTIMMFCLLTRLLLSQCWRINFWLSTLVSAHPCAPPLSR